MKKVIKTRTVSVYDRLNNERYTYGASIIDEDGKLFLRFAGKITLPIDEEWDAEFFCDELERDGSVTLCEAGALSEDRMMWCDFYLMFTGRIFYVMRDRTYENGNETYEVFYVYPKNKSARDVHEDFYFGLQYNFNREFDAQPYYSNYDMFRNYAV